MSVSRGLEWLEPYLETMTDLLMPTSNHILVSECSLASMVGCFVTDLKPPKVEHLICMCGHHSSGHYFTGDGAYRSVEGYYQITGRMDDVINISGHRLGTAEIEDALVSL